jgi:hypothetical protein
MQGGTMTPGEYSINALLAGYERFGIPHFQRGLTWNTDQAGRLLESLLHDTPCGSIILWKPKHAIANGLPLTGDGYEFLIVDGQQRIRSLYGAFCLGKHPDDSTGIWCVNLVQTPELRGLLHAANLDRPLFLHVSDPEEKAREYEANRSKGIRATASYRYQNNVIPLNWFLGDARDPADWRWIKKAEDASDTQVKQALDHLRTRLRAMLDRRMFVIIRTEDEGAPDNWDLASMVALYNRINSAGIRVEAEERAFASMIVTIPEFNDALMGLFREVRKAAPDSSESTIRLLRDDALRRARERSFGFKLFMRVFVQTVCVHLNRSVGTQGLPFDLLERSDFAKSVQLVDSKESATSRAEALLQAWRSATLLVAEALTRVLHCDDFRFVPDATSLIPAFQVALQFAGREGADFKARAEILRPFLAWLILTLMIDPPDSKTSIKHARAVQESDTLDAAAGYLGLVPLDGEQQTTRQKALRSLRSRLEESNSLANRYVLLLYWLIRRNRAEDFQQCFGEEGEVVKIEGARGLIGAECDPEKQHIVPYSRLCEVYGLDEEANRATTHPINNIGNLTYLSHECNHWEHGLGRKWAHLSMESADNKVAHFLSDASQGGAVLKAFERVRKAAQRSGSLESNRNGDNMRAIRAQFEKMCDRRRTLIANAFDEWREQLRSEALAKLDGLRIEPVRPICELQLPDRLRDCDYPPAVEDALLALYRQRFGAALSPNDDGIQIAFSVRLGREKEEKLEILVPEHGSGLLRIQNATRRGKTSTLSAKFLAHVSARYGSDVTFDSPLELSGTDEDKTPKILRALLDYDSRVP